VASSAAPLPCASALPQRGAGAGSGKGPSSLGHLKLVSKTKNEQKRKGKKEKGGDYRPSFTREGRKRTGGFLPAAIGTERALGKLCPFLLFSLFCGGGGSARQEAGVPPLHPQPRQPRASPQSFLYKPPLFFFFPLVPPLMSGSARQEAGVPGLRPQQRHPRGSPLRLSLLPPNS